MPEQNNAGNQTTDNSTNSNNPTQGGTNSASSGVSSEDIAKIVNLKLAESRKEFETKLKETESAAVDKVKSTIISALNPEEKQQEIDPLHEAFAKAPAEFIENIVEVTKEEVRKDFDKKARLKQEVSEALAPMYAEYPDLQKLPNEIYHELGKISDDNLPQAKKLEMAAKKVADRMGFTPKSSQRSDNITRETAMMPNGTSFSMEVRDPKHQPGVKTLVTSAADYMTGLRSRFASIRGNAAKK